MLTDVSANSAIFSLFEYPSSLRETIRPFCASVSFFALFGLEKQSILRVFRLQYHKELNLTEHPLRIRTINHAYVILHQSLYK